MFRNFPQFCFAMQRFATTAANNSEGGTEFAAENSANHRQKACAKSCNKRKNLRQIAAPELFYALILRQKVLGVAGVPVKFNVGIVQELVWQFNRK